MKLTEIQISSTANGFFVIEINREYGRGEGQIRNAWSFESMDSLVNWLRHSLQDNSIYTVGVGVDVYTDKKFDLDADIEGTIP